MEQFRLHITQFQSRLVNFYEQVRKLPDRDLYCLMIEHNGELRSLQRIFNRLVKFIENKFPEDEWLPIRSNAGIKETESAEH
jgi:hypothetical protein